MVSVVKVLVSKAAATEEAVRLTKLNKDKQCIYEVCVSRLIP